MKSTHQPRLPFLLARRPCVACALALLAAGLPGAARAQQPAARPGPAPEGMVWRISGGDNTVYLGGSVHLLREEDHPVSPAYDTAYAASDEVVFEVDMAVMTSPEGIMKMQSLGLYGADDALDRHLKSETIDRLRNYFESHEMGRMLALALPRMKPGMIFLSVSSLEAMRLKARPDLGLEAVYFEKAKQDGKPTGGLETVEYQMSLFDGFSDAEMEALLLKTLDDVAEMPQILDQMIAHWQAGESEALDRLLNEEMDKDKTNGPRLKKLLLTDRNANWVPKIEKALAGSKDLFFIVGAAHLIGREGVIERLRQKGHRIEKVKPAPAAPAAPMKKAA